MKELKMIVHDGKSFYILGAPHISSNQVKSTMIDFQTRVSFGGMLLGRKPAMLFVTSFQRSSSSNASSNAIEKSGKIVKKPRKREHHLWKRRDSAGSGDKAMNLVRIVSGLPNEREAVDRALDQWIAWELEFPLIAAAKALRILKKQRQWLRVVQVAKWMLSKGQGTTMATYDTILLAFDQMGRLDEAGSLWNMILHTHTRSISKRLFSRMISLYDHHDVPDKIIEVFADMEELGVKPDEDTVKRVARAFETLDQDDKKNLVVQRYGCKWKYVHFKGERVKVRRYPLVD
ncbi:pentatricopeptide repeat-containing protein At4g18975, chloroplastic [Amaranthus tricolor]|uniref:pentatricopeptide repeat-containing protein At4g18975, chloroplastic n=1 Tax=Amaranthus tricolor TaxID=29722 RepID=UPI00258E21F2|nr:pentatricopeptide repeat-containing protein At4g18975, chloroplastic [Amaranthus tricolor]XP_057544828.1 pentatricopeptide repeat-containing protein At4g18975, chloroplastic [Amaranthus tricolor]XP_057544830.1 pentatricopeptide repeat-containing protein At4g18975, chloroplastic [Amaranthus tricolor]XP_057544831.1 pentatricopeptide repeat-containing protein At4g18975, chloroplastic [Amaranthus tricolor]XP_057544832.1 pentatricopeptide repeat-containing protein At4g18975, chloroplastic [Amaran